MSTFDGYFREFNGLIRVDNFGDPDKRPRGLECKPVLYLLSHAHSDHMTNLENFSASVIYCSSITKEIVMSLKTLNHRVSESINFTQRTTRTLTYRNLRTKSKISRKDLLRELPILEPSLIQLDNANSDLCRITLIPANHCPGSVMFLIQMWEKTVLYTGDIRAEPWWVESLTKEPILIPHIAFPTKRSIRPKLLEDKEDDDDYNDSYRKQLSDVAHHPIDNIYLDTAGILTKFDVMTKDEAINLTIENMADYPKDTIFFINAWTWGYEEILQQIAARFKTKIHVDDYKYDIMTQENFKKHYPLLKDCLTTEAKETRFHSCERKCRCEFTWGKGSDCKAFEKSGDQEDEGFYGFYEKLEEENRLKVADCKDRRIVFVNPFEFTREKWRAYYNDIRKQIKEAKKDKINNLWPSILICPFTRHSSLIEIYNLISIFKPKSIFPNTTQVRYGFLEFSLLPIIFRDVLCDETCVETLESQAEDFIRENLRSRTDSNSNFYFYHFQRIKPRIISNLKRIDRSFGLFFLSRKFEEELEGWGDGYTNYLDHLGGMSSISRLRKTFLRLLKKKLRDYEELEFKSDTYRSIMEKNIEIDEVDQKKATERKKILDAYIQGKHHDYHNDEDLKDLENSLIALFNPHSGSSSSGGSGSNYNHDHNHNGKKRIGKVNSTDRIDFPRKRLKPDSPKNFSNNDHGKSNQIGRSKAQEKEGNVILISSDDESHSERKLRKDGIFLKPGKSEDNEQSMRKDGKLSIDEEVGLDKRELKDRENEYLMENYGNGNGNEKENGNEGSCSSKLIKGEKTEGGMNLSGSHQNNNLDHDQSNINNQSNRNSNRQDQDQSCRDNRSDQSNDDAQSKILDCNSNSDQNDDEKAGSSDQNLKEDQDEKDDCEDEESREEKEEVIQEAEKHLKVFKLRFNLELSNLLRSIQNFDHNHHEDDDYEFGSEGFRDFKEILIRLIFIFKSIREIDRIRYDFLN